MYKSASRFRQGLAKRGKKLTGRNLVASDSLPPRGKSRARLTEKLDEEVERATAAKETFSPSPKPLLVKRSRLPDSN